MANYPKPKKGSRHNAGAGYQSGIRRALREQRQFEAKVRQDIYSALTLEERVAKLKGLDASKQRAKLARQLRARAAAPATAAVTKKSKSAYGKAA